MVLVQHVSKVYPLFKHPAERLRQVLPLIRKKHQAEFYALRDVSFEVRQGETVALVGPNGSGKSTALQIVTGILQPSSGRVLTSGRIAALLELGAGSIPSFPAARTFSFPARSWASDAARRPRTPSRPSSSSPASASSWTVR